MKTKEEMRDLYQKMRQAQGDMKNAIDMVLEEVNYIEASKKNAYESGYAKGFDEGCNFEACKSTYEDGLNDAWEAARKIFSEMNIDEVVDIFGGKAAADNRTFFMLFSAQEAIEKLNVYEAQKQVHVITNEEKFKEVFGWGDPDERFGSFYADGEWWEAPYKEPENDV